MYWWQPRHCSGSPGNLLLLESTSPVGTTEQVASVVEDPVV